MAGTAAGAAKRAAAKRGAAVPTDRKPRVRRSTAGELLAKAEALAEREPVADDLPDDGSCRVEFEVTGDDGKTTVHVFDVKSPGDWRQSAMEALAEGMFFAWARAALYPESAALWAQLDLTNRQCTKFMNAFDAQFRARYGEDPASLGKRLGS